MSWLVRLIELGLDLWDARTSRAREEQKAADEARFRAELEAAETRRRANAKETN